MNTVNTDICGAVGSSINILAGKHYSNDDFVIIINNYLCPPFFLKFCVTLYEQIYISWFAATSCKVNLRIGQLLNVHVCVNLEKISENRIIDVILAQIYI